MINNYKIKKSLVDKLDLCFMTYYIGLGDVNKAYVMWFLGLYYVEEHIATITWELARLTSLTCDYFTCHNEVTHNAYE